VRNRAQPARLHLNEILAWADAHYARTGRWPSLHAGPIPETPHENWRKVDNALRKGYHGL